MHIRHSNSICWFWSFIYGPKGIIIQAKHLFDRRIRCFRYWRPLNSWFFINYGWRIIELIFYLIAKLAFLFH